MKNDAALARELGVAPPVISKIRHARLPIGPVMLIMVHEATGKHITQLRAIVNGEY